MTFMDDYLAAWNYWNYKQCSFVGEKIIVRRAMSPCKIECLVNRSIYSLSDSHGNVDK